MSRRHPRVPHPPKRNDLSRSLAGASPRASDCARPRFASRVSIGPGHTAFTVMPYSATSCKALREAMIPTGGGVKARGPAMPALPSHDAQIDDPSAPRPIMWRIAARQNRKDRRD